MLFRLYKKWNPTIIAPLNTLGTRSLKQDVNEVMLQILFLTNTSSRKQIGFYSRSLRTAKLNKIKPVFQLKDFFELLYFLRIVTLRYETKFHHTIFFSHGLPLFMWFLNYLVSKFYTLLTTGRGHQRAYELYLLIFLNKYKLIFGILISNLF